MLTLKQAKEILERERLKVIEGVAGAAESKGRER
jgi:hypothetical protein